MASLSVTGLAVDDSGSYRLDVSHTAGARSTSFQLNVQSKSSEVRYRIVGHFAW